MRLNQHKGRERRSNRLVVEGQESMPTKAWRVSMVELYRRAEVCRGRTTEFAVKASEISGGARIQGQPSFQNIRHRSPIYYGD